MKIKICIFLIVSTLAVYSQVQNHEFLNYDDDSYITENQNLKDGFSRESVIWAFTSSYIGVWSPITWLSFIFDFQLYELNPKGYHLANLFFHISNAIILFLVLLRMTGAIWQSAMVAAMFALHPLNVDSVAWIAERKNVLSTLFWFLTIWTYIRYVKEPCFKSYSLVFIVFVLGLMSKSMLITLPFTLILLDYWPLNRLKFDKKNDNAFWDQEIKQTDFSRLILEKLPLFVPVIFSILISLKVREGKLASLDVYPMQERIINALTSYLVYIQKTFWPSGLSIFYAYPVNDLQVWKGLICGLILIGITILAIRLLRQAPYFVVGWFWFLGTLVPVIGIVQAGTQAMADRYSYVPLIGIFIMIAWGLPDLIKKWRHKDKILTFAAGIYIFILMLVTWNQVGHWKNSISIFQHAIRVTDKIYPGFSLVHYNLAIALGKEQRMEEAINHYRVSVNLEPNYPQAHFNFGNALSSVGNYEEAVYNYQKAINRTPALAPAHNNMAVAMKNLKRTEEAITHFKIAIKLLPDYTHAHYNLANTLSSIGKIKAAISHYKMAINLNPDFAEAHNNMATALKNLKRTEEAITHYKIAIKLMPDYTHAHYNLGNTLLDGGKKKEAISHFKTVIKLKPSFTEAQNMLKKALDLHE